MRSTILILAIAMMVLPAAASAQSYHRGYYRSNGTYVQPHYQTNPDSSRLNNWSTRGNVNPYTGEAGTESPYPAYNPPRSTMSPQPRANPYGW